MRKLGESINELMAALPPATTRRARRSAPPP